MKASYKSHVLQFKRPGGTSRGVLTHKETWFLVLSDKNKFGIGECALFRGLSYDDVPDYEQRLKWVCDNIKLGLVELLHAMKNFPSIQFGLEQAFLSFEADSPFNLFPSDFTRHEQPIVINGLIWMGNKDFIEAQIKQRLADGFRCLKLKIGALDFNAELQILEAIRSKYSVEELELRVDANGAFEAIDVYAKLEELAKFNLHSIEQPVKPGNYALMKELCSSGIIDIALDEELIGIIDETKRLELLQIVKPQYLILKPSLLGGFRESKNWISMAEELGIRWWITSALESNIGLNAIAQWTYTLNNPMPQGLGTGSLFTNNIEGPLEVKNGKLIYNNNLNWNTNIINDLCT